MAAIIPTPLPFIFVNGTVADATQVNSDLNTIVNNVNLNAAHSGANSDITQITGLTTPLSVPNGGTGLATITAHATLVGEGAGTVVPVGPGTAGQILTSNGAAADPSFNDNPVPRGFNGGLILSTAGGSTTFNCSAGVVADSTAVNMMALNSGFAKTQAAWVAGSGVGSLDTGVIAVNTWYHVFLIKRPDTGLVDLLISLSATAPTLPTNYTLFRRLGSLLTDNPSHFWLPFVQVGSHFLWTPPITVFLNQAVGASALLTLTASPLGVKVRAIIRFLLNDATGGSNILISSGDEASAVPNAINGNMNALIVSAGNFFANEFTVRTNTSAQFRAAATGPATKLNLAVSGWYDDDRQFGQ